MNDKDFHHTLDLRFRTKYFKKTELEEGERVFFNGRGWAKSKIDFQPKELLQLYIFVIDKEIWKNEPVTRIGMTSKTYNKFRDVLGYDFKEFIGIPIIVSPTHPFPVKNRTEGVWTNLCSWS